MNPTKSNVVSLLGKLDQIKRCGTIMGEKNVMLDVLGNMRKTSAEVILKIEGGSEVKLQAVQIVQLIRLLNDYLDDITNERA